MQRDLEIDYLRRLCIPEVVLLLHSVLHSTDQFDKAIALADLVASEQVCDSTEGLLNLTLMLESDSWYENRRSTNCKS